MIKHKHIESIKNSKIKTFNIAVIKTKKGKEIIGYIIELNAYTNRKVHQGSNTWYTYYLISDKQLKYKLFESKNKCNDNDTIVIGKYDGEYHHLTFKNYIIEINNNITLCDIMSENELNQFLGKETKKWKYGGLKYTDIEEYKEFLMSN